MTATLAFCDTETTGLDPDRHEVWEVGLILRTPIGSETEYSWQLPVDLGRADSMALTVGRFYERRSDGLLSEAGVDVLETTTAPMLQMESRKTVGAWARRFAELTHGAHLVGAVPSFDAAFLSRLLRANGACPGWHYHLIDVEALAAGWLAAGGDPMAPRTSEMHIPSLDKCAPPWRSNDLSRAVGVEPDDFDRHTALGDARWAKAIYDAIMVRDEATAVRP